MVDTKNWTNFGLLDPEAVSNIKIACVFGLLGFETLMVTKTDEVFGFGSNASCSLGFDTPSSCLLPIRVDSLCNKGIKGFAFGAGPHVLAFTSSGTVYAWGHNGYAQLGLGTSCATQSPTLIGGSLTGKKVIAAACGSHHSVVLTSEGEVFCWGQNTSGQVGCGSTANQPIPRRVSAVIGNCKIVHIACAQTSTFAVSDTGELFAFGYNGTANLGIGNTVNQYNPTKVHFPVPVFVKKVVCGVAHTLVLGDDGSLYTFGANSYGQLGNGHKANVATPARVAADLGRIVDIGAHHTSHISTCATHTKIYMWGQCHGQCMTAPVETPFKNILDAFACYSCPPITYVPLEAGDADSELNIVTALKLAFDDPKTSDVQFVIDGKTVHAHKAILRIRSDHFRCMFQGKWEENQESVIKVDELGVSFSVFRAFLQYLYTDVIDLPHDDAVDLLKLANYYCETRLRNECETLIKQSITINNAARLYASAILYNAKELEDFTKFYIAHHLMAVVKSESFSELDGELVKTLIVQLADYGAFKY